LRGGGGKTNTRWLAGEEKVRYNVLAPVTKNSVGKKRVNLIGFGEGWPLFQKKPYSTSITRGWTQETEKRTVVLHARNTITLSRGGKNTPGGGAAIEKKKEKLLFSGKRCLPPTGDREVHRGLSRKTAHFSW